MAGQLQVVSRGCRHGLWHIPSTSSPLCPAGVDGGCWGPAGCPCKSGLPQGFSITGAAPGPSSLLLLSIRGEATGRAEKSLPLGFSPRIPFLPVTDQYSPQRQPGRASAVPGPAGWHWADAPQGHRWVSMTDGAWGSRAGWWVQCPARGLFPSKKAGGPGVSHPTAWE